MIHIARITTAVTRALAANPMAWDSEEFEQLRSAVAQTVRLEDHARLGLELLNALVIYQQSVVRTEKTIAVARLGAAKQEGPQE